jgi:hypothetical protein
MLTLERGRQLLYLSRADRGFASYRRRGTRSRGRGFREKAAGRVEMPPSLESRTIQKLDLFETQQDCEFLGPRPWACRNTFVGVLR